MLSSRILHAMGLGLVLWASSTPSFGATIAVPSQVATIQSAVDSASTGDVVSVAPGSYHECVDFKGKSVSLVSAAGPAVTTLAAGPAVNEYGPFSCVLTFHTNETHQTVVSGFTIDVSGVGVSAAGSSPTITDNIFICPGEPGSVGMSNSNMVFERNLFSGWTAHGYMFAMVGIGEHSSPTFKDNVFFNNHVGAPALYINVYANSSPDVGNNTFIGNDTAIVFAYQTPPGATRYRNNLIYGNGVGVQVVPRDYPLYAPTLQNNLVYGNTTNYLETADQTGQNGNISVDPMLSGLDYFDFHPDAASPVIDAGFNLAVDPGALDFYSGPRTLVGTSGKRQVDIGAAEYSGIPPTVNVTASTDSLLSGQQFTISWTSTNATKCSAAGAWTGPLETAGTRTVVPAAGSDKYSVVCANAAAARGGSVSVRVYAPPTVTIAVAPPVMQVNYPSVVTWSSTDSSSCIKLGAWSGPAATSGSESVVSAAVGTFTYGLTCTGPDGTGSASAVVTVPPAPTIMISSSSTYVAAGQAFTLTWKTSDATTCNGDFSPGSGLVDTNGSMLVGPLTPEQQAYSSFTYRLGCYGPGGATQKYVSVVPIKPTTSATEVISVPSPTIYPVTEPGKIPTAGGLDGHGYSFASSYPVYWMGKYVTIGSDGQPSASSRTTVPLSGGRLTGLSILATSVYGSQLNQPISVTYTDGTKASFIQNFSDWGAPKQYAGETTMQYVPFRITPSGALQSGKWYFYSYTFALDPSKTVSSLTLPTNRNVVLLGVSETAITQSKSVDMSAVYNVTAIATAGQAASGRGIDGQGYGFAADLLGPSIAWAGETFTLGAAVQPDAASNAVIPLLNKTANRITILATGINGAQPNQKFLLTYADGGTTELTQSISDWGKSSNFPGESIAASTAYRITPAGAKQAGAWRVYAYTFDVYAGAPLKSLTLPKNPKVVVLAVNADVFF